MVCRFITSWSELVADFLCQNKTKTSRIWNQDLGDPSKTLWDSRTHGGQPLKRWCHFPLIAVFQKV